MNVQEILSQINGHPEKAKKALESAYRGKVFVVAASHGRIDNYFKTHRGAEGYIKRQQRISYYDDYSQDMVTCGAGLQVVEIEANRIKDYKTDKKMWHNWFLDWLGRPFWADNIVHCAKQWEVDEDLLTWIEETAKEVKETHGLRALKEDEETEQSSVEQAEEKITEEGQQNIEHTINNDITITINEEFNGVEIRFTQKPAQEVIDQLKASGFRWSKFKKVWYAKQSEQTLVFAQSLTGVKVENIAAELEQTIELSIHTYPEIDIDDLDKYTVSDELQRRLHSSSMFEVDYKRDCALTFQNFQSQALEVIALTDDPRITYYIKKYLQSFKKCYYEQYLKILNHKANNPSWIVTGRGGLNVRRYNKMQERYDKYLEKSVKLSKEFKKKMGDFRYQIDREKQQQIKQHIEQSLNNTDNSLEFITETRVVNVGNYTENVRAYVCGEYVIAKSWGCFRIWKNGMEVHSMKTTERLSDAKKYVTYLISQEDKELVTVS